MLVSHDLELVFDHADGIHMPRLGHAVGVRRRVEIDGDKTVGLIMGARA